MFKKYFNPAEKENYAGTILSKEYKYAGVSPENSKKIRDEIEKLMDAGKDFN